MKKQTKCYLTIVMGMLLMAMVGCKSQKSTDQALRMIDAAQKSKDYSQMMFLTDSLETEGDLLPSTANYWRGYASDRLKQKQDAASYWAKALEAAEKSTGDEDISIYVKSASRLANQLCLSGNYESTLQMALPVVARLEELKCDTTSDYVNLLIYIGLSQISTGQSEEEAQQGFIRACEKHRQNIDRNHSDNAYKDAIAGLVNIAYYCVKAQKYEPALYYTRNFGELLIEYEQRRGVDSAYIDRQIGRFTIYKAKALKCLDRKEEADRTYEAFLTTKFSKSSEGQTLANDYMAAEQ
ncbi:MAG: hypothetical protein IJ533_09485 [Prevotella sp.]|nr:hypothetical protein [Prevotella sp.]